MTVCNESNINFLSWRFINVKLYVTIYLSSANVLYDLKININIK